MEAENTLTLSKEVSSEIFFKEEAIRIREAFANKSDGANLEYLRHQLQCMKSLVTHLELPWDRLIPVLFRLFGYYMRQSDNVSRQNAYQLTSQLIDCITYLSQNGRMVNTMAEFFDRQIKDLDLFLAEKAQPMP